MVQTRRSSLALPSLPGLPGPSSSLFHTQHVVSRRHSLMNHQAPLQLLNRESRVLTESSSINAKSESPSSPSETFKSENSDMKHDENIMGGIRSREQKSEDSHTDDDDSPSGGMKNSSTLKLASNKPDHFLRDVNLDHCSNLLSIPDPPSPRSFSSRRRQSSPFVQHAMLVSSTTPEESNALLKKPARKSLCHVPSPATLLEPSESIDQTIEKKQAETLEQSEHSICLDDDDDETGIPKSADRKRRQSMFIPKQKSSDNKSKAARRNSMGINVSTLIDTARQANEHQDVIPNRSPLQNEEQSSPTSDHSSPRKRKSIHSELSSNHIEKNSVFDFPTDLDPSGDEGHESIPTNRSRRQSLLLPSGALSAQKDGESHTQRKKRRSIVLPSDIGFLEEDEEMEDRESTASFFQSTNCERPTSPTASGSSDVSDAKPEAASPALPVHQESDVETLRTLVRSYCALPNTSRNASAEAAEIVHLTGYPMPVELEPTGNPEVTMNDRRQQVLSMTPTVQLIEANKQRDSKEMEELTGCRIERGKKGKQRYFEISTNRKVKPSAYMELYYSALAQIKLSKQTKVEDWLQQLRLLGATKVSVLEKQRPAALQLDKIDDTDVTSTVAVTVSSDSNAGKSNHSKDALAVPNEFDEAIRLDSITQEETPDMDSIAAKVSCDSGATNTEQEVDESMEICDADESIPGIDKSPGPSITNPTMESRETRVNSADEDSEPSHDEMDQSPVAASAQQEVPMPSREEESMDPEIAAAEQRLWTAIDAALAAYSKEVMDIQEARRTNRTHEAQEKEKADQTRFQC